MTSADRKTVIKVCDAHADSVMLAPLHVLTVLGGSPPGTRLSVLVCDDTVHSASGGITSGVAGTKASPQRIPPSLENRPWVPRGFLDAMTVTGPTWWCNARPPNTEPLLVLNAETPMQAGMEPLRDKGLAIIGQPQSAS